MLSSFHLAVLLLFTQQSLAAPLFSNATAPSAVCIFDVDRTLTRPPLSKCTCSQPYSLPTTPVATPLGNAPGAPGDGPGAYAAAAIAACLAKGYAIGIATDEFCTAEPHRTGPKADPNGLDIHIPFLRALGVPEALLALNGTLMGTVKSPLQCHPDNDKQLPSPDKSQMLLNIASFYGVKPANMILWDDTQGNLNVAQRTGVPFQCAGGECGWAGYCDRQCGITKSDFERGLGLIGKAGQGGNCA